jgi:VWFA-related protein
LLLNRDGVTLARKMGRDHAIRFRVRGRGTGPTASLLSFLFIATCVVAQESQGAPPRVRTIIQVTTRPVLVDVVVHDKKGQPVKGLTRDDFAVFDGGSKQRIATFSVQSGRRAHESVPPLPPDVVSNRVAREGGVPANVAVILLDAVDTRFEDEVYAREQAVKFLRELQPQDRVAVCVLGTRLQLIQDFTDDPAALLAALGRAQTGLHQSRLAGTSPDPRVASPIPSGLDELASTRLNEGMRELVTGKGLDRTQTLWSDVLPALQAIANHLAGLPGRKSLIWLTGDVPLPQVWTPFGVGHPGSSVNPLLVERIRHTIQVLNEDDVAVYPIDARGLFTDPAYSAETRAPPNPGFPGALLAAYGPDMGMLYYAQQTGGRAFYNTNDLKGSLRDAIDDSEVTYTLGYYPDHVQWDGKYRPIKVTVDRKGLQVRYRRGYFATAGQPEAVTADPVTLLKAAAESPLDATAIGVSVRLRPVTGTTGHRFATTVYIDLNGFRFQRVANGRKASFVIWAGQYASQGGLLGGMSKTVSAELNSDEYQKLKREGGFRVTFHDKAKPQAQDLRVAVRDSISGAIGSVRAPMRTVLQSGGG